MSDPLTMRMMATVDQAEAFVRERLEKIDNDPEGSALLLSLLLPAVDAANGDRTLTDVCGELPAGWGQLLATAATVTILRQLASIRGKTGDAT